jgi:hypothetical protein
MGSGGEDGVGKRKRTRCDFVTLLGSANKKKFGFGRVYRKAVRGEPGENRVEGD